MTRPKHPDKNIEAVLQEAEGHGWKVSFTARNAGREAEMLFNVDVQVRFSGDLRGLETLLESTPPAVGRLAGRSSGARL